ncbi:membrane associated rhomboid family serine protease [Halorubrum trapanicum]|uniref:Membrane associated rhomboid family serine protease n=1 Tax=Halorubrum trapanicum TaxID=29284 RepID=A0A8J7UNK3_9EURY|nr:rhomboid family intramembrane serine protease [Halorubrum trapanicum]MBP1901951.1 membrane associated rhomboid family serine protease [Halorubrum trapanicum]
MTIIIGVFGLAESTRRTLSFAYADPSLWTAYTAPFVHFSAEHLAGNVAVFLLVSGAFYALSRHARTPWLFLSALVAALSIFPVTLSLLNLAVPRDAVTYGFSGVNMALVGFLPVAIGRYIEANRGEPIDTTLLLTAFFLSISGIAILAVPQSALTFAVGTAGVALSVLFGGSFVRHERRLANSHDRWRASASDPVVIVGTGTWILLLATAFPQTVAAGGSVTNVYVHFVGYALGFMTAYLAHEWEFFENRVKKRVDAGRPGSS